MTSAEIKQRQAMELSERDWLREVAFQLALLNEKRPTSELAGSLDALGLLKIKTQETPQPAPTVTKPKQRY